MNTTHITLLLLDIEDNIASNKEDYIRYCQLQAVDKAQELVTHIEQLIYERREELDNLTELDILEQRDQYVKQQLEELQDITIDDLTDFAKQRCEVYVSYLESECIDAYSYYNEVLVTQD
jgi:hypothetical protein